MCGAGTPVCNLQSEDLASEQTRQRGDNAQAVPSRPAQDGHHSDDSLENILEARQGSPHIMDLNGKATRRHALALAQAEFHAIQWGRSSTGHCSLQALKAACRELSGPRKGRPPRPKRRKHATGNM